MKQPIHPTWLIAFCMLFFTCGKNDSQQMDKLGSKSAPYDQFSFQRSYPDRDFDWRGWRTALQRVRNAESNQERGIGCGNNSTNWTLQGPANVGGRVNTLAVKPNDENTVLAGFSAGGIFKTSDGGINWHPVFDDNLDLSIGHITFDPSNPQVVYAGTGDPNIPSIVFNGNGVYKSTDAGEHWQYLGLAQQGIISKVLVNPNAPQVLFAATMGNPYKRDNERGIYKSTDGGANWQQVLFVSDQAGASDLVMSPVNPQILYASFWDRIRNNHESVIYGAHAHVYKSIDGGENWVKLNGGLPTGTMGRTGLAISQQNPDKVYAVFVDEQSTPGGLYKTTDGGTTWVSMNMAGLDYAYGDFGWYFGKIRLNPGNDEELYFLGILLWKKPAASNTWTVAAGGHADSHDLVFTPSGRRFWGNDGGVYFNEPNQLIWPKCKNLPVTQFYHTTFNPHQPTVYWAGAQDNGIQKGNAAVMNNWVSVFSADGFHCAFDPVDPNTFWVEIQNGAIQKTTDGGNSWQSTPSALGTGDRTNWDTPFFMSSHNSDKLYAATYRAYTSENGSGWAPISSDLTDGVIWEPRFHTVSCMNESPLSSNKLLAGTSDGNVWRSVPTGSWTNISAGLPDRYVTSVHGSPSQPSRIFVTHSGFRDDEYIPHIHRSDNNGNSWNDISGDLPQVPVNDFFVLPGQDDKVLFAATDAGIYFTLNGGNTWKRLGGNMPYIPVFDLEHNPVRKELVAATFARGIWTFPIDSVFAQQSSNLVDLEGTVKDELGQGVENVQLGSENTNSDGIFNFSGVSGCQAFTLTPYRNDAPVNGVTTYDLVLINKHILGVETLNSPYKMIAADANASGSITTFDIVTLRKLILGVDTAFSGNTSWRFLPASFSFLNLLNPFQTVFPEKIELELSSTSLTGLDFIGLKVGDVNNTAVPGLNTVADDRTRGEWPLRLQEVAFTTGDQVEAIIGAEADWRDGILQPAVSAAQFSVRFDPNQLVFEKVEPLAAGISAENFGVNRTSAGLLTFGFENPALPPGTVRSASENLPLFRIRFRAKNSGNLSNSIYLDNWPTPSLAFRFDGTPLRPVLEKSAPTPVSTLRVWPNPFGEEGVWLDFKAPITRGATLDIFDAKGVHLYREKIETQKTVHLESALFETAGIYFYKLTETDNGKEPKFGKLIYAPR